MICFLGEAYGEQEERIQKGFVGAAGIELFKQMAEAGIISLTAEDEAFIKKFWDTSDATMIDMIWAMHPELYRTNVFNIRPPGNKIEAFCGPKEDSLKGWPSLIKGKYVRAEFKPELERLGDELLELNPNLIVCLGNTATWAMLGKTNIGKIRGTTQLSTHTAEGFKVLPTYHPAAIFRQWELRPIVVIDLAKAKRESSFAEVIRPKREIWIEPSLDDLDTFYSRHIHRCPLLSVDIENPGGPITCIGFAPTSDLALVVPFVDYRKNGRSYWPTAAMERKAWNWCRKVIEDRTIPKLFQNGLYDIAVLLRGYGIATYHPEEDTMLLHHALQPESLKALDFLGSIYTDEGPWKQLRKWTGFKQED